MILISVGAESHPFDRLMYWTELLLNREFLSADEEIVVHCGNCTVSPSGVIVHPILSHAKLRALLNQARLVITHCSSDIASLLEAVSAPYILVPRSSDLGECEGTDQISLATALAETGVPIAWSPGDLVRFMATPYRVDALAISDRPIVASRT